MRRGTRVAWAVGLALLMLVLALPGCWNPFKPDHGDDPPVDPTINRKSPKALLNFFAYAYINRDLDKYAEAVDDNYTFTFDLHDWEKAGVSAERPYWGKTEDVPRTGIMFDDPKTKSIKVDWLDPVADWEVTQDSIQVDDQWQTVSGFLGIFQPDIQVTVAGGAGEEDLTYWVHKSRIIITAIHDRTDTELWTVLRMTEVPIE